MTPELRSCLWIVICLSVGILYLWMAWYNWQNQCFEKPNGTIWHRKYGTYPKVVPYKDGMTLYPKQTARMTFSIPLPENVDGEEPKK